MTPSIRLKRSMNTELTFLHPPNLRQVYGGGGGRERVRSGDEPWGQTVTTTILFFKKGGTRGGGASFVCIFSFLSLIPVF